MQDADDRAIIRASAYRLYGAGQPVWDPADRWNSYKRLKIDEFAVANAAPILENASAVLNAGCGDSHYDWLPSSAVGIDRFLQQASSHSTAVCGNLERLPFKGGIFDFVVCVGSVLNYVSAAEAIEEMARIVRPGAHLLLHFESSQSLERIGLPQWGAPVVRNRTVNAGREDHIWVYRPSYIDSLLRAFGFVERERTGFHIVSALAIRLGAGQQVAARAARLDWLARPLRAWADDVILLAEKA